MTTCKNCETTFEGKYCSNCSQKADTHRFTVTHLAHELLHALTHTDKGVFFLIKEMFYRPGKVALEYNAGRRKKYFNPISFLLIMMALQLFVAKKAHVYDAYLTGTEKWVKEMTKSSKTVRGSSAGSEFETAKRQTPKILENAKILSFLFIPIVALLTWLFFKKSKSNYAENLIFNVLLQGQIDLFFILFCIIPFLIYPPSIVLAMYFYLLLSWIYSIFAYKQFYQQRWFATIWKGILIQILYVTAIKQVTDLVIDYL
jgi:hypothetical protein